MRQCLPIIFTDLPAFSPQLSSEWCAIECVRTTAAGARGPTTVSPVDISDGAAPVLSPATSLMGEPFIHSHTLMKKSSFDVFSAKASRSMFELILHESLK